MKGISSLFSSIFSAKPKAAESLKSPMRGKVITQEHMQDQALASLGTALAIIPDNGAVYSPVNGTVQAVFPTKHAIGLISESGAEIIIHIGIDTVKLDGKYFTSHVKEKDVMKAGQLLLEFDIEAITNEGYILESPIILTNSQDFENIDITDKKHVNTDDNIMSVVVK